MEKEQIRLNNFSKRFKNYLEELQLPENTELWKRYGEQLNAYERQLGTRSKLRTIKKYCKRIPHKL